jgi:PAS domain-containing protein
MPQLSFFEDTNFPPTRMGLLLYGLVTPPFTLATYLLTTPGPRRALPALIVLSICAASFAWIAARKSPSRLDWILPGAASPIVCCGIAYLATGRAELVWVAAICGLTAWVGLEKQRHLRSLEQALRASEQKFSSAFHNTGEAIYISECATGHYLEVNRGFESLAGYAREEVLGRSSKDVGL